MSNRRNIPQLEERMTGFCEGSKFLNDDDINEADNVIKEKEHIIAAI
jgi:hypothetical protein